MNITMSSSRLLGNSVANQLAVVAQALGSMVRVRSSRATIARVESAGDDAEQRDIAQRARLDAAARATFAVLHQ